MSEQRSVLFGCTIETSVRYLMYQACRLVASIRWFGGTLAGSDIRVCVVDDQGLEMPAEYRSWLEGFGVELVRIPRFHIAHKQSNKIGFMGTPRLDEYDSILMLDCDTLVVQDPREYVFKPVFQARMEHWKCVPDEAFQRAFEYFNLIMPAANYKTICGHCSIPLFNAGVLVFPKDTRKRLASAWYKYAYMTCQDSPGVLNNAQASTCTDEVAMTLALMSLQPDVKWELLPPEMHLEPTIPDENFDSPMPTSIRAVDPIIIHYHASQDPDTLEIHTPSHPACEASRKRISEFTTRWRAEAPKGV